MSNAERQEEMAAQGVKYIFAQFTDIHGAAKGKLIPLAHLDDIIYPGAGFSGPSIWGTGLPRNGPRSEYYGRADLSTLQAMPWLPGYARVVLDGHVAATGQFEVNYKYADALKAADNFMLFKMAAHRIAEEEGMRFSMMPKPFADRPGSGLHFHLSIGYGNNNRTTVARVVIKEFVALKRAEWIEYSQHVSAWKTARYIDRF